VSIQPTTEQVRESMIALLIAARRKCDNYGVIYAGVEGEASRRYMEILASESGVGGPAYSAEYTGWDRIHDENREQGRPNGGDWDESAPRRKAIEASI